VSPGKRFELSNPTVAIESVNGKRVAITVPSGSVVKIVVVPNDGDTLLDVLWDGRLLVMFAIDLDGIATELPNDDDSRFTQSTNV